MFFHQHSLILDAEMKTYSRLIILTFVTCTIVVLLKKSGFKAENSIGILKISESNKSLTESFGEADRAIIKEREVRIESSNSNVSTNIEATTEEAERYTARIKEQAVKTKFLWPNSEGCSDIVVTLAKDNTYPLCGLFSSPGSGNTWTRYIIESMTGIATGAVYNDSMMTGLGYIGESAWVSCGCTIVQKSHSFASRIQDLRRFGYRAIVLVRNPYKQVVSYVNYKRGKRKAKVTNQTFTLTENIIGWNNTSLKLLRKWILFNSAWINNIRSGIVVHYENLQNNMMAEVKRILQFLDIPFIKERYECMRKEMFTGWKTEKSKRQEAFLRTGYTEELHNIFDAAIRQIDSVLKQKGHPSIPYHLYSYYNETKMNYGQHPVIN